MAGIGGCGDQLRLTSAAVGLPAAPLRLTASLPERVSAGDTELTGEVSLVNDGDTAVSALTAVQPDLVVTRNGRIVATPLPRDDMADLVELEPGATRSYRATADLVDCATGAPLAPGTYEVYALLDVRGPDGEARLAREGPWPLEVT